MADAECVSLRFGHPVIACREACQLGFDLGLTGFGELELGALFAEKTDGLTDPDEAPEPPEYPVSMSGDLWLLGRHRILCGDSTVAIDSRARARWR